MGWDGMGWDGMAGELRSGARSFSTCEINYGDTAEVSRPTDRPTDHLITNSFFSGPKGLG